jgi:hypothetical protein
MLIRGEDRRLEGALLDECCRAVSEFNLTLGQRWRMGESLQHHLALASAARALLFVLAIAFELI